MKSTGNAVRVVDARRVYGEGAGVVRALDGVSLEWQPGEFAGLMGPSGSGKSTLLHCIGCLDALDGGFIEVGGKRVDRLSEPERAQLRARHIGFVFQQFNLIPVFSALENVAFALEVAGESSRRVRNRRAQELLERVGLTAEAHRRPGELSGGQQQRVAVARALVKSPQVVLADEPTANLDSATGQALIDLMAEMNEDLGVTFIFATHDEGLASRLHRVIRLVDGRVHRDEGQR